MRLFSLTLPVITGLAVATGMGVAIWMAVTLLGVADGFERSFLEIYGEQNVTLMVSKATAISPMTGSLPEKLGEEIATINGVTGVCPNLVDMVALDDDAGRIVAMQAWPAGNYMFDELKITQGEYLGEGHKGKKAVLVGCDLARLAKLGVSDRIELLGEPHHVVGVFKSHSDVWNNMVFLLLDDAQELCGKKGKITGCTVRLADDSEANVARVRNLIENNVAERLGLKMKGGSGRSPLKAVEPEDYVRRDKHIALVSDFARAIRTVAIVILAAVAAALVLFMLSGIAVLRLVGFFASRSAEMASSVNNAD